LELELSVPPLSARILAEVETRPAKVQEWLARLPVLNLAETGRKLFSTLTVYNRMPLEPPVRLALLELYRAPAALLAQELRKQYIGQPLPLTERQQAFARDAQQLQLEMAIGYKRVLLDARAPERARGQEAFRHELALAAQRALRHLTGALVVAYQAYSPYPPGSWREIHTIHRHAEALGLAELALPDPQNPALAQSSVAHAYKQALLLDLAGPYRLPVQTIDRVHHYLDRWAGLAALQPANGAPGAPTRFLIDQDVDRSGIIYLADAAPERPEHYRLLNTVALARRLHAQLKALQAGEPVAPDGLAADFFQPVEDSQQLLRRLLQAYATPPKRAFRRSTRIGSGPVEVVIGVAAVNHRVNGGAPLESSASFVGPLPQRTVPAGAAPRADAAAATGPESAHWDMLDESAGGAALARRSGAAARVRVGELAAVRAAGETRWHIGVVRWAKSAGPANVEVGVQWIAPSAAPALVKVIGDHGKESDFLPALLLPEVPTLKQSASLVTTRGVFRPQRIFYLDNGALLQRMRITRPDEISPAFERFEFEELGAESVAAR
jgi:hypothetical protein